MAIHYHEVDRYTEKIYNQDDILYANQIKILAFYPLGPASKYDFRTRGLNL